MKLTLPLLRVTYDRLRHIAPFNRWQLPPSQAVKFLLSDEVDHWAATCDDPVSIKFCSGRAWTLSMVDMCMAHEMIHVRQAIKGKLGDTDKEHHDKFFHQMASAVCKECGFDPEDFGG